MKAFPAIRTRPLPDWRTALAFCAKSGSGMVALALTLGAVFIVLSILVRAVWASYPLIAKTEAIGLMFFFSPVLTIPVLVCSVPVVALAARSGYAGWLVACTWGIAAALFALWALDRFVWHPEIGEIGTATGLVSGALFWMSAKLFYPEALCARRPSIATDQP